MMQSKIHYHICTKTVFSTNRKLNKSVFLNTKRIQGGVEFLPLVPRHHNGNFKTSSEKHHTPPGWKSGFATMIKCRTYWVISIRDNGNVPERRPAYSVFIFAVSFLCSPLCSQSRVCRNPLMSSIVCTLGLFVYKLKSSSSHVHVTIGCATALSARQDKHSRSSGSS